MEIECGSMIEISLILIKILSYFFFCLFLLFRKGLRGKVSVRDSSSKASAKEFSIRV